MSSIQISVNERKPTNLEDGYFSDIRGNSKYDLLVFPMTSGWNGLAADGYYFRACNPTFGTGIAQGIQASFSDTANVLCVIRNTSASGTGPTIFFDYIRLINTAARSSTTSSQLGIILDTANRYSSGGTQLIPSNVNTGVGNASVADIRFGAVTATAASAKRQISRAVIKTQAAPCWTVGDQVLINFGSNSGSIGLLSGSSASQFCIDCGPVALGPGGNHSLLIHMWNAANATTAPSWEVEIAWWER